MNEESQNKKVVLTAAQPTGRLHLGNYLGAVKNWAEMSEDYECYFGIADMHAMTIPYVPAELRKNVYDCAAQYMACGLDPQKCSLFVQSGVYGHADLAWILGCLCPLGALERMTQYKDKARKHSDALNSGLLYYPVLMASDILIYNADLVPVGADQKQHLELTRDLAIRFNNRYGNTFTVPEPFIPKGSGARIMSLADPSKKMSKSDENPNGFVTMSDDRDTVLRKFRRAVTDSEAEVRYDPEKKPGVSNLLTIYCAFTGKEMAEAERDFAGKGYGDFKLAVGEAVADVLGPIRSERERLLADKAYLNAVMKRGEEAARIARRTLAKVYRKVGFYAGE